MIRKVLVADRGVSAVRIVRTCRRLGIRSVAVYSDADKQAPHAHLADEAVALAPSDGAPAARLLEAARQTGADALHPGCGPSAADAELAAACESSGVTFIGPSSSLLRTGLKAPEAAAVAADSSQPDARRIEVPLLADRHGNVLPLLDCDGSIRKDGKTFLCESPAPALDDDLRARLADAAVALAREGGWCSAATVRFLLTAGGNSRFLGADPFLSIEHPVTEAATGLDLVQLQFEIAEGRRLPTEVPRAFGHAVGIALHADAAPGTDTATTTIHVWDPPPATGDLRVEAGVAEGMQIAASAPLLAHLVGVDAAREGAARKLSLGLESLWVGGVATNRELLSQVLQGQDYRDGKLRLGFLDRFALDTKADEASDVLFAAAAVLYWENDRHAQRAFLPAVPPNYRNNPYRDPSTRLRIGKRDLAIAWRRLGRDRYKVQSADTELNAEVLALQPGSISVALDGVLRKFRLRQVGEEVFVHSPLGARVLQRLPRFPRRETAPSVLTPTVVSRPRTKGSGRS